MDDLFESFKTIAKDADNDARLRDWFRNINGYIRYINTPAQTNGKESC